MGGGKQVWGDCTGPGLSSPPWECGVPILGDGCMPSGDMLFAWFPGLCSIPATGPELGDAHTNGAGLGKGELCWAIAGEADADGDSRGD